MIDLTEMLAVLKADNERLRALIVAAKRKGASRNYFPACPWCGEFIAGLHERHCPAFTVDDKVR